MELKGQIEEIIFSNEINSYTVCTMSYGNSEITATGYLPFVNIGDIIIAQGEYVNHSVYGRQFKIDTFEKTMPTTNVEIEKYLGSGIIKGVGPATSKKIVDKFGDDTIYILQYEPEKLVAIKGITATRAKEIGEAFRNAWELWQIVLFLQQYGIGTANAGRIYKELGMNAINAIKENPYILVSILYGVDFKKIDQIALSLGVEMTSSFRISSGIKYALYLASRNGHTCVLTTNLLEYVSNVLGVERDLVENELTALEYAKEVYIEDDWVFSKDYYKAEENVAKKILMLSRNFTKKYNSLDDKIADVESELNIELSEEQRDAVKACFKNQVVVITGGPGTGKTTIIKAITRLYAKVFKVSNYELLDDIVLLAPTGRASKRIMEAVNLPSQTIHRFLKWNKELNKFGVNEHNKSDAKLVIIDEFSMVDTYLFDSLLKGLKYDTKIILVGDYHQLPSVGSGQLLKDFIESNQFNCIKLENLYRQSENSNIISFAYDINHGIVNDSYFNQDDDLTFIKTDSYNLVDKISEICYSYKDYPYNKFQIMAPMYKTINGIDNLNMIVQNIFNPKDNLKKEIVINDTIYREGDKVLELVNMPDDNIYNGDIGIIDRIDTINKEIYVSYDGNIVKYNKSNFKNFKLGYVISIHKSQGSEFPIVIMPILSEYNRMLYRKLIYTGVTRAKKNLYLLGEMDAIKRAINNDLSLARKTRITDIINEMYEEKNVFLDE